MSDESPVPQRTGFALAVLATVFFAFGFATAFKDVLVPHLIGVFDLNHWQGDLVQFAFFSAYFLVSIPSTIVVSKLGHQNSIVAGMAAAGVGALLFIPAASLLSFNLFLVALWVLAAAITLIQVAANPFATLLGAPEKAPARLTLVQAFNSLGAFVAPALGGALILAGNAQEGPKTMAEKLAQAGAVKLPYLGLAAVLFVLAFLVWRAKMPRPERAAATGGASATGGTWGAAWKYPHLVLGLIAIFVYVGAEVTIGGHIINYVNAITGIPEKSAAVYASLYWGGAMAGRFVGTAILRRFSGGKVLGVCGVMALLMVLATMTTSGMAAVGSVVLVGLFNSIMFPTIFALAVAHLGPLTGKASGLLLTAAGGGALIPLLQGKLIDSAGYHISFIVPALCYAFIMFYGFRGSRVATA